MHLLELAPSVGFGTSGVRALVADLTPPVVWAYTRAFVAHLRATHQLQAATICVVGWDLRPSSPHIASAIGAALAADGFSVEWAGQLPTPALALRCLALGAPGIMVTGSHIPFDRNGIKFYTAKGEILKADEAGIFAINIAPLLPVQGQVPNLAETQGQVQAVQNTSQASTALQEYRQRYTSLLPSGALKGLRVGVYQHSAIGRDFLADLLGRLGASVVPLDRSDTFVPIDTEAVSATDEALAAQWCQRHQLHAVVSTDGDGDRPWVCDEQGHFIRGDILCTLTAMWLGVQTVVTPVSSNTALEKSGQFTHTQRTRIGSPYVIEAMQTLHAAGRTSVAGFEANGGFLLQTQAKGLQPLPTRDSTLPILAALTLSQERKLPISALPGLLPPRYTQADRLQNIPTDQSRSLIEHMAADPARLQAFMAFTGSAVSHLDTTDGLRVTLANQDVVHLRPSGNAPELRCYTESANPSRAHQLLMQTLETVQKIILENKS